MPISFSEMFTRNCVKRQGKNFKREERVLFFIKKKYSFKILINPNKITVSLNTEISIISKIVLSLLNRRQHRLPQSLRQKQRN